MMRRRQGRGNGGENLKTTMWAAQASNDGKISTWTARVPGCVSLRHTTPPSVVRMGLKLLVSRTGCVQQVSWHLLPFNWRVQLPVCRVRRQPVGQHVLPRAQPHDLHLLRPRLRPRLRPPLAPAPRLQAHPHRAIPAPAGAAVSAASPQMRSCGRRLGAPGCCAGSAAGALWARMRAAERARPPAAAAAGEDGEGSFAAFGLRSPAVA